MEIVRAAGGILWRNGSRGPMLALVHRPHKDDWTLPKGKLKDDEGWQAAAQRETEEETGCRVRVIEFAGCTFHSVRRGPKIVLYWHMTVAREGNPVAQGEVDEVAWLLPADAAKCLDDQSQRRLVQRACSAPLGSRRESAPGERFSHVRAQLLQQVLTLPAKGKASVLERVIDRLGRAEEALTRGDLKRAKQLVVAAQMPPG
jgi:ADP-ribose pyrophosphatase YjhB (NUDIX family)